MHTKCADQFCGCCVSVWRVALSAFVEPMNVVGIANSELLVFLYGYSVFCDNALFVTRETKNGNRKRATAIDKHNLLNGHTKS